VSLHLEPAVLPLPAGPPGDRGNRSIARNGTPVFALTQAFAARV